MTSLLIKLINKTITINGQKIVSLSDRKSKCFNSEHQEKSTRECSCILTCANYYSYDFDPDFLQYIDTDLFYKTNKFKVNVPWCAGKCCEDLTETTGTKYVFQQLNRFSQMNILFNYLATK